MIDVAITGLYTSIIQDGLRLHAWREPELAAMQKQLTEVNLLPLVRASFKPNGPPRAARLKALLASELRKLVRLWRPVAGPMGRTQESQIPAHQRLRRAAGYIRTCARVRPWSGRMLGCLRCPQQPDPARQGR